MGLIRLTMLNSRIFNKKFKFQGTQEYRKVRKSFNLKGEQEDKRYRERLCEIINIAVIKVTQTSNSQQQQKELSLLQKLQSLRIGNVMISEMAKNDSNESEQSEISSLSRRNEYCCQISQSAYQKTQEQSQHQQQLQNQDDFRYCTVCFIIICKQCLPIHDTSHLLIENIDLFNLPKVNPPSKMLEIEGNISPEIHNKNNNLNNNNHNNQSNDSKMISEETFPNTEERITKANPIKPNNQYFLNQINFLEEDSEENDKDDDDDREDSNESEKDLIKMLNIQPKIKPTLDKITNSDDEEDDDDDDMINFASSKVKIFNPRQNMPLSPTSLSEGYDFTQNFNPNTINNNNHNNIHNNINNNNNNNNNSKSSINSRAVYIDDPIQNQQSHNQTNQVFQNMNKANFLQVPQQSFDFTNVKQQINSPSFNNMNMLLNQTNNNLTSYQAIAASSGFIQSNNNNYNSYNAISSSYGINNSNNNYQNQVNLTPLQNMLFQKGIYHDLLSQFYTNNPVPKNVIVKKAAKVQGKKKRKGKDLQGNEENDESTFIEEDVPIPELSSKDKDGMQVSYDNKGLNELKARSKKILDEIKAESDIIFKEIKPHIHGVQYSRDEMDRINKYKKYAIEGVESYFLYIKDIFNTEYDKLKKCKKRDKLSKMMNKIIKITDNFQYYKEPKDFINFLNKDYKQYFNQIKIQLNEVQKEGNDFPPQFKIVYENLYDIFDSLLGYMSVILPNQKNFNEFTQPIISTSNSKSYLLPVHYPSKKMVGIWNSRTSEIEVIEYDDSKVQDFEKFSSFQIVNDNDFIYFIGGMMFNPEKNTFSPSSKCFKMSIHSGEIIPLKDMPIPKMKFGITLVNNSIYVFGGLQTIEKHRTNACEKLDILTNTWKLLPHMEKNRVCPLVSTFIKQNTSINSAYGQIYLFGGMEDKNNINYSIEIFDYKLEVWIDFIDKPINSKCYVPKQLGYALQINNEQILMIGGSFIFILLSFNNFSYQKQRITYIKNQLLNKSSKTNKIIMKQKIGMSGRKQKATCSMQVYNTSKKSITNLSLDSLPVGVYKDGFSGQPIIFNKSIYLLNTQISQYFPVLKYLQGVCNIFKIGMNQQEIICTHTF